MYQTVVCLRSPFDPSCDNALDKIFLAQKEEDQTGQRHHQGGTHEQIVLGAGNRARAAGDSALKIAHPDGQGVFRFGVEEDQGAKKVVPMTNKAQRCHRSNGRFAERRDDLPQNAPTAGAIDLGRFVQIKGNAQHKLAHEEDIKRTTAKPGWDNQRIIGIDPVELFEEQVGWNQRHLDREHNGAQGDKKEEIPPWKAKTGKAIGHNSG